MGDDREQTETEPAGEPAERRRLRFGHLPAPVRPEDLVETAEADPPQEEPAEPMVRREWW